MRKNKRYQSPEPENWSRNLDGEFITNGLRSIQLHKTFDKSYAEVLRHKEILHKSAMKKVKCAQNRIRA